jgi:hypothetical protein
MTQATEGYKYLTPEAWLDGAYNAINNEQWNRATAYAAVGLLSLAIGAAKGLLKS